MIPEVMALSEGDSGGGDIGGGGGSTGVSDCEGVKGSGGGSILVYNSRVSFSLNGSSYVV